MNQRIVWAALFFLMVCVGASHVSGHLSFAQSAPAGESAKMPDGLFVEKAKEEGGQGMVSMFEADAKGNLVVNEKTRLKIEELYALNTPKERKAKLRELAKTLPAAAHKQLVGLTGAYKKYTAALKKKYPPHQEVKTVKAAVLQHDGLHALRVKYFGADVAEAFFSEEEKLSQKLLEIMGTLDESIPMADRAHMAQEILRKSMDTPSTPLH